MNVSISGHHISVTEAMDNAVREKLVKVERHFDQIQSIQVKLSLDNSGSSEGGKKTHKAEAIMRVAGQELDRQVRKYKTRQDRKKTQGPGRDERYEELTVDDAAPVM